MSTERRTPSRIGIRTPRRSPTSNRASEYLPGSGAWASRDRDPMVRRIAARADVLTDRMIHLGVQAGLLGPRYKLEPIRSLDEVELLQEGHEPRFGAERVEDVVLADVAEE